MKKVANIGKLYFYYTVLISFQIISGCWLWYRLSQGEPSIWQSGTLAFVMLLPIGLILGGLLNGYFLQRLFKTTLNHPILLGLFSLLIPLWLAMLFMLFNALLFVVIG